MGVQAVSNNSNNPFIKFPNPAISKVDAVLKQDAGRTAVLAPFTVLAKVAATGKYVPFTDETATDGSAVPCAIYIGPELTAASIAAGDIANLQILFGAAIVDKNQLVFENSKTLATVINPVIFTASSSGASLTKQFIITVEDALAYKGIYVDDSVDIFSQENT